MPIRTFFSASSPDTSSLALCLYTFILFISLHVPASMYRSSRPRSPIDFNDDRSETNRSQDEGEDGQTTDIEETAASNKRRDHDHDRDASEAEESNSRRQLKRHRFQEDDSAGYSDTDSRRRSPHERRSPRGGFSARSFCDLPPVERYDRTDRGADRGGDRGTDALPVGRQFVSVLHAICKRNETMDKAIREDREKLNAMSPRDADYPREHLRISAKHFMWEMTKEIEDFASQMAQRFVKTAEYTSNFRFNQQFGSSRVSTFVYGKRDRCGPGRRDFTWKKDIFNTIGMNNETPMDRLYREFQSAGIRVTNKSDRDDHINFRLEVSFE